MRIYRSAAGEQTVRQHYRDLLDRWPVPNTRQTLPTRHGDTFVITSGPEAAPPVIALQGSGANSAMWLRQIGTWAPHLRVHAVDVIGEPGLSAPARPPLESGAYAEWLDDVLAGLGLDEVAMVGVSLGGRLAVDYATRRPGRVGRLVLLAPSGIGQRRIGVLLAAALLRPLGEWGLRRTMRLALGPAAARRTEDAGPVGALALLIFQHFSPRRDPVPTFDDDTLRRLTMPVLAVVGGRDAFLDSAGTRRRLEAVAPSATVRFLPEAGHLLPDQALAVLQFLTGAGRR
ncbi:alpha/beta hydrolase [Actinoplanes sp. NPDC049548]|uniref:alpha/beta fold hydrolase n=1 Tax=Actinoplanes sp. NPDC049548 TaxID=3155152 RepID=UPI003436C5FC